MLIFALTSRSLYIFSSSICQTPPLLVSIIRALAAPNPLDQFRLQIQPLASSNTLF